ncbi:MAG TPA: glycoside hydrolase family 28 protein [Prolixibacteraceae bacterium]|nr:glycoside hydrolase family 28 protein [Prolixibacteraceae bacterium]
MKKNFAARAMWALLGVTSFLMLGVTLISCTSTNEKNDPWAYAQQIVAGIQEPSFPDKTYSILDYGAKAEPDFSSTQPINAAIEACSQNGGGKVLVPEGVFFTGAIHLKSNVNLVLTEKAVLSFSVDPADYLPVVLTRWEGIDCYNFSPLIYATGQENVAITGSGLLQGNASIDNWWKWKGREEYGWLPGEPSQLLPHARPRLDELNKNRVPVEERIMGDGYYLRPQFIHFHRCKNILISDITIENSPFWVIHPLLSENITVRNVHINSLGTNNDGFDPESCKNVLVENCYFNTGDDCIALKSGRNNDGLQSPPVENVVVRECHMENGHGGVVLGSEISGGVKNVFVENCTMDSPELDRAIRIKTNSNRGGIVENIHVRNVKIGEVNEAILRINCKYDIKKEGTDTLYPVIRNVNLSGIECEKSKYALLIEGIEGQNCIYGIHLSGSNFRGVEKKSIIREAKDITLENVTINGEVAKL